MLLMMFPIGDRTAVARAEQSMQPVALLRFIIGVCLESLISDSIGYISHTTSTWQYRRMNREEEENIYCDNFSPFFSSSFSSSWIVTRR